MFYSLFLIRQQHNPHTLKSEGHNLNLLFYIFTGLRSQFVSSVHTERIGLSWDLRNSPCALYHCPGPSTDYQLWGKLNGEVWSLDNWAVTVSHFSQKVSGETSLVSWSAFLLFWTDVYRYTSGQTYPRTHAFYSGYTTSTTVPLTHKRVLLMNESIL